MYLFKERVKEMIVILVATIIMGGLLYLIYLLLSAIPFNFGGWTSLIILSLFILVLILSFLNWLIIEPFKESLLYWKIRNKINKKSKQGEQ